jgi:hypothetical protein
MVRCFLRKYLSAEAEVSQAINAGLKPCSTLLLVTVIEKTDSARYSAVVGSMTVLISDTLLAGKPPWLACSRTIFSLGAI